MKLKSYIVFAAGFSILVLCAALLSRLDYNWQNWSPATCMPSSCFCEALRVGPVRQPANTWSSLGFVLVGFWIVLQAMRDVSVGKSVEGSNPMFTQLVYGVIYGTSLIVIGVGSAFYHASLTLAGQFIDVMGMYLLAGFMVIYNLSRSYRVPQAVMAPAYLLLVTFLAYPLLRFPQSRRYIFAAMIIMVLLLEYSARRQNKSLINTNYIYGALGLLVLAFIIWILDITRLACSPESWFQGHAIWHILGALATVLLYMYYRSEKLVMRSS